MSTLSQASMPDIEWSAVDVDALSQAPQSKYMVSMLVILNDLDSIAYLNQLLANDTANDLAYIQKDRIGGARLFLLRQNITVMVNFIKDAVSDIADKSKKARDLPRAENQPKFLWHLINDDEKLTNILAELIDTLELKEVVTEDKTLTMIKKAHEFARTLKSCDVAEVKSMKDAVDAYCTAHELLPQPEEYSEQTKALLYVRDKIGAHVDAPAVKGGLTELLPSQKPGILWRNPEPPRFRAIFIDDSLSACWQTKGMAVPKQDKTKDLEVSEYVGFINKVKHLLTGFIYGLFHAYCSEHKLFLSEDQKLETLNKIIQAR